MGGYGSHEIVILTVVEKSHLKCIHNSFTIRYDFSIIK